MRVWHSEIITFISFFELFSGAHVLSAVFYVSLSIHVDTFNVFLDLLSNFWLVRGLFLFCSPEETKRRTWLARCGAKGYKWGLGSAG